MLHVFIIFKFDIAIIKSILFVNSFGASLLFHCLCAWGKAHFLVFVVV